ncbi:MAG: GNAT family N-acetyltransferase [Bacteroidia bacterium]|nr:GNAT family N-acetyltransferase [Bacteroidia bacterium]
MKYIIESERVGMRAWKASDLDELAAINADPEVMKYFNRSLNKEESGIMMQRLQKQLEERGYTYFAAEEKSTGGLLGFVGLHFQDYEAPVRPFVDIGWRLKRAVWGKGFAPEAAKACLAFAFEELGLDAIYSVTPLQNSPSERVMQKIGMKKIAEFGHPKIPDDSEIKVCVFYEIKKEDF